MPVRETVEAQTSALTRDGWTATRQWKVGLSAVKNGGVASVLAVTSVAPIGSAHPFIPSIFLEKLTPSGTESRLEWVVTGEYSPLIISGATNPLEEPTVVSWGSKTYTVAAVKDKDGNPVVNSAGQPFDPPATREEHVIVATITYNSKEYDPTIATQYEDTVNEEATVIGTLNVEARAARIAEIGADPAYFGTVPYWQVAITAEIKAGLWDRDFLDYGIFQLVPGTNDKVRMRTDDGEEVTEPILLDGEGHKLNPQTAAPVFLTYKMHTETDFSILELAS